MSKKEISRHDELFARAKAALLWSAHGGQWSARITPAESAALLAELQKLEKPTGTVDSRTGYTGEDDEQQ